ncbi:MAG: pyridoxal phosphate-dependent aminotransferase [Clostridiales bacterium]|nr:pyridoxal phosphate-dependent aminotransferase [Clostridiales bacterium]
MYDFTTIIDRKNTGAFKYDFMPEPLRDSGIVPMTVADMEFAAPPEVNEAVAKAAFHGCYGYTGPDKAYMDAVKHWQKTRHDWEIENDWYVVTNGVVQALGIAVRAFTKPGDGVLIMTPVYHPFYGAVNDNGRTLVKSALINNNGRYEIDFDDLESKAALPEVKLMLLCSPHNPIGRVWSRDELQRISDICLKNGVLVVSDEIHNDLILPGFKHTVFASVPGASENCIVCTAISKTFNLAGLSCSNIFIPNPELHEKFRNRAHVDGCGCVPYIARAATIAAYNEGANWLDELISVVDSNFGLLYRFFEERLPMFRVTRAEGTYLAWIDMRSLGLGHEKLNEFMIEKARIADNDGEMFGEAGDGFRRWNLALPQSLLNDALLRLEKAVKEL